MTSEESTYFHIGIRLSFPPAIISGILIGMISLFWVQSLYHSLLLGAGTASTVFILVYLFALQLLKKRLEQLHDTILQTPSRFTNVNGPPDNVATDEIQRILNAAEWCKATITHELKKMDETDNYRKEFIGDISHELKTPIFSVQGYLETLQDGALEDPKVNRVFLAKAMKNVNRLIFLTNDLLEISRLETGELKPDLSVIPLNNLIHDAIDALQYKAEQRNVTLIFEEKETNAFALADRNQIRQVLVNLIENSIKYNKTDGKVHISTRYHENDRSKIVVSVRDTGIGIDPEDVKRVTERFFRVDKSRSREQGGTGLGLSIVKHILESHGEQLVIESNPGSGSIFRFTLKSADYHSDLISAWP